MHIFVFIVYKLIASRQYSDLLEGIHYCRQWRRLHNVCSYVFPSRCDDSCQAEPRCQCNVSHQARSVHCLHNTCCLAYVRCVYSVCTQSDNCSTTALYIFVSIFVYIYCSVIRSVLEYACPVWHPGLTSKLSKDIERVYRNVAWE